MTTRSRVQFRTAIASILEGGALAREALGEALRPWEDEEYRRYQGMPADHQPQADPGGVDLRWVRRPIAWLRWRSAVRRRGPYAPDFDEFRQKK